MNHAPEGAADRASLLDLPLREVLERLGSADPAPGGGAAAAVAGALGAALVQMTANLTLGRPKFADVQDAARAMADRAAALRDRLAAFADADADAYGRVSAAYRLPRDSDEQRAARGRAVQAALGSAAEVPLDTARAAADLLAACEAAAPVLNPAVISDVMVGALLAQAALEAAAVNVEVNLAAMDDQASVAGLDAALAEVRATAGDRLARTLATARSRLPRRKV